MRAIRNSHNKINISIVLALPSFLSEIIDATQAVSRNSQALKARRLTLKARPANTVIRQGIASRANSTYIKIYALKTVGRTRLALIIIVNIISAGTDSTVGLL